MLVGYNNYITNKIMSTATFDRYNERLDGPSPSYQGLILQSFVEDNSRVAKQIMSPPFILNITS